MRKTIMQQFCGLLLLLSCWAVSPAPAQFGAPRGVVKVQAIPPASTLQAGQKINLALKLTVQKPFHINANPASETYLIPTQVIATPLSGVQIGQPVYPRGEKKKFSFSPKPLSVYEGTVTVQLPLTVQSAALGKTLSGVVKYQACNDKSCLVPSEEKWSVRLGAATTTVAPPASTLKAPVAAAGAAGWGERLQSAPLWLQLVLVFVGGLLLNLTPCVYPMIPITVGYFGAQSQGRTGKTFSLAIFYVLGLALMYSALGMTAALTGSLFGSALQSPWAVGFVALILLALSLSMFGLFTIQPPQFVMARSGAKQGAAGALAMGALLGIVAAPCVGPVVAALLTYVGTQKNVALGFGLFFTLSLGLGLPYLLLGIFSGALKALPRSGAWMEKLKKIFAVPLLIAALYYGYSAFNAASVRAARPDDAATVAASLQQKMKVTGLPTIIFLDANGNERTELRAGEELTAASMRQKLSALKRDAIGGEIPETHNGHWPDATQAALDEARRNRQPVVLDFRADWCLPCLKLEKEVFSRSETLEAARGVKLLRVDLTSM